MASVTSVRAWVNNEVAYVAWDVKQKIPGCLGFEVTRVYLDANGNVAKRPDGKDDRVKCATWVAFKGQKNPNWLPQDTGVWPVQKCSWRDLTLRKKRDGMKRRPDEVSVRYEIRPLGDMKPGLEAVPSNGHEQADIIQRDKKGKPILDANGKPKKVHGPAYEGKPRPLGYLEAAVQSNDVRVTRVRPPFETTFTNGILAAQWLKNVLLESGEKLIDKLSNPNDPHRKYLAGDVLPLVHAFFAQPGTFHAALYELEDKELEDLLIANAARVHLILSNSSVDEAGAWDARNANARKRLKAAGVDTQPRMFNNATDIGHNKFVVHLAPDGSPQSVLTGSTNWTSTGVAGQTNNCIVIRDAAAAKSYLDYWKRMKADVLKVPKPLSKGMSASVQGEVFRKSNAAATTIPLAGGAEISIWYSPNRIERSKSTSKAKKASAIPGDLTDAYRLMRQAKEAVLFLAFYPGQKGVDCIIGEAIDIGRHDPSLIVMGAVSSAQAMPNYIPTKKDPKTKKVITQGESPAVFEDGNVAIVRAAAIDDRMLIGDLGREQLTAKGTVGAIIHDKIVVVDPRSKDCAVIFGSHNLGFKASYSNDENMVIVKGHQELAAAYAVHILDVYDHYRFRAIASENEKKGKKQWSGFLETTDKWLDGYVAGTKGVVSRYFAKQ